MTLPTIFQNLIGKLRIKLNVDNSRTNSPSLKIKQINITINSDSHIANIEQLKNEILKLNPIINKDLEVNESEKVNVSESVVAMQGNLQMTKITNNPSKEELELVQLARGNRPYNSITNVRISYDEKGNKTSLQWNEN